MSRFFASGDSDPESDDDVQNDDKPDAGAGGNRFAYGGMSDSDSDQEKRVVRSAKDKRYDEMMTTIRTMKNHMKINDFNALNQDFESLNKQLLKAKQVVQKEGIPRFYFKAILFLDDFMKKTDKNKDAKQKMSKANVKGLNTLSQKMKKHIGKYQPQVDDYLKNPLASDDEKEEEAQIDRKRSKPRKQSDDDEDEDEEDEDRDEDEDEEGSGDDGDKKRGKAVADDDDDDSEWDDDEVDDDDDLPTGGVMYSRDYWVKKVTDVQAGTDKKADVESKKKKEEKRIAMAVSKRDKKENLSNNQDKKKEEELTPERLVKKLNELLALRGKRSTDREEVIRELRVLAAKAVEPAALLKVKTTLASALFDLSLNKGTHMPIPTWIEAHGILMDIVTSLVENPKVRLSEDEDVKEDLDEGLDEDLVKGAVSGGASTEAAAAAKKAEEKAKDDEAKLAQGDGVSSTGSDGISYVIGNFYSFVQKMAEEFTKSLQNIDPHIPDYVTRLRDEKALITLVTAAQSYYNNINKIEFESRVALMRLELLYYQYRPTFDAMAGATPSPSSSTASTTSATSTASSSPVLEKKQPLRTAEEKEGDELVIKLAAFLYKNGDSRSRTRALLCHVYYLALHNHYSQARDLMLMSHAQDTINDADIRTRILFNRTMAQFGLCCFRVGHIKQALWALAELYQTNRGKELIAQGISIQRFQDRDLEKEKLERRRQYPYHMHINLDMLEAVHYLCAMFIEVPNMAMFGANNKRKVISKAFRKHLEYHMRQAFNGPPENSRDVIMAATKALRKGDWVRASEFVMKLRMWSLLKHSAVIKEQVMTKIKEVALRTHLLTYGSQYVTISKQSLCDMFQLPAKDVQRHVSKMVESDMLSGAWDQPSDCLVMHSQEQSQLQKAAIEYADKAAMFLEQNERLADQRQGGYYGKDTRKPWVDYGNTKRREPYRY